MTESVVSPCNGVCTIDPATGLCQGCQRTIDEIMAWPGLGDDEKLVVWDAIFERRS